MKLKHIVLSLLLILTGVLFYTNPDDKMHKDFIKEKFVSLLNEELNREIENIEDPRLKSLTILGRNFLPAIENNLTDELVNSRVRRKNFYLFSITQVLYKEEWRPIGIGIFNKLYLFPKVEEEFRKLDLKAEALKYFQ